MNEKQVKETLKMSLALDNCLGKWLDFHLYICLAALFDCGKDFIPEI